MTDRKGRSAPSVSRFRAGDRGRPCGLPGASDKGAAGRPQGLYLKRHRPPAVGKWRGPLCSSLCFPPGIVARASIWPQQVSGGKHRLELRLIHWDPPPRIRVRRHETARSRARTALFSSRGVTGQMMSRTDECRGDHGWSGAATGRTRPRRQPPDNGVLETGLTQEVPQSGPSRRAPAPAFLFMQWLESCGKVPANVVATHSRALPASRRHPCLSRRGQAPSSTFARPGRRCSGPNFSGHRRPFFNVPVRESPLPVRGSVPPGRSSASLGGSHLLQVGTRAALRPPPLLFFINPAGNRHSPRGPGVPAPTSAEGHHRMALYIRRHQGGRHS